MAAYEIVGMAKLKGSGVLHGSSSVGGLSNSNSELQLLYLDRHGAGGGGDSCRVSKMYAKIVDEACSIYEDATMTLHCGETEARSRLKF